MDPNSLICDFIAAHPDDWRTILPKDYRISLRFDGKLCSFLYDDRANFFDPLVQEARGLIVDVEKLEVVCRPFRKFGVYDESYADKIDWPTSRVQEKIDGSIVKLWFDRDAGKWEWSTNASVRAKDAVVPETELTFEKLIFSAVNYRDIDESKLDRDLTYIFELVSPENRIVIRYEVAKLYHLGTRSNRTGEEFRVDIGVEKPREYPLSSLEECVKAVEELNRSAQGVENEGFVVVDAFWNRVKIKAPEYLLAAHSPNRGREKTFLTKKEALEKILEPDFDADAFAAEFPALKVEIKYYEYKLEELYWLTRRSFEYVKALDEEFSHDRVGTARAIGNFPFELLGGYQALDALDGSPDDFAKKFWTLPKLLKQIPDFKIGLTPK